MNKPKYETCRFAERTGQVAVYVTPGCPMANMIRGVLVSTKADAKNARTGKGKVQGGQTMDDRKMRIVMWIFAAAAVMTSIYSAKAVWYIWSILQ